jgi:hypothetical protein
MHIGNMRYIIVLLMTLSHYAIAFAKPVEMVIDFTGSKATSAQEVLLTDDRVAWIHGNEKGAGVTINGEKAEPGIYSSKDGNIAFSVDEEGNLKAPITVVE